jgi:hypothetical protein
MKISKIAFLLIVSFMFAALASGAFATECDIDGGNGCCVWVGGVGTGTLSQMSWHNAVDCEASNMVPQHTLIGQTEYACVFAKTSGECPSGCFWYDGRCHPTDQVDPSAPSLSACWKDADNDGWPTNSIYIQTLGFGSCNGLCAGLSMLDCYARSTLGGQGNDMCLPTGAGKCVSTTNNGASHKCARLHDSASCGIVAGVDTDCSWNSGDDSCMLEYGMGDDEYNCETYAQGDCDQLYGCHWYSPGTTCIDNPSRSNYMEDVALQTCASSGLKFDCNDANSAIRPCADKVCGVNPPVNCFSSTSICGDGILEGRPGCVEECERVNGVWPSNCLPNCTSTEICSFNGWNNYFEIQNSDNVVLLRADQNGALWIKGSLKPLPASGVGYGVHDFLIKTGASSGPVRAWLDAVNGDLYVPGGVANIVASGANPSSTGNFVIRNSNNLNVLWFNSTGLYLKGCIATNRDMNIGNT